MFNQVFSQLETLSKSEKFIALGTMPPEKLLKSLPKVENGVTRYVVLTYALIGLAAKEANFSAPASFTKISHVKIAGMEFKNRKVGSILTQLCSKNPKAAAMHRWIWHSEFNSQLHKAGLIHESLRASKTGRKFKCLSTRASHELWLKENSSKTQPSPKETKSDVFAGLF